MSVLTETKDLKAVIEYVRNLSYTDSEKILLMGCSQGGFVSALVAAKNNFPIEKLVLFYPALCIPDDARAGKMMMAKFDPQNVPDTFRCGLMKLGVAMQWMSCKWMPLQKLRTTPAGCASCMVQRIKS